MPEEKRERRKLQYERRKRRHEALLEARKALYEQRKARAKIGVGIRGITISPRGRRAVGRVIRGVTPEVLKPEYEEKPPLVDVIDENEHLRIDIQLSGMALPRDITIDEITDLSFRHGVLELRLRKRKKKVTKKEEEKLAEVEKEITAEIKKKVLLLLKKRKIEEEAKEKFIV